MGRIGKPQKRKKNKIKKFGWYKNNETVNSAPKNTQQEVPRRLREMGIAIKELKAGKRNRNKFKNKPDGPKSSDTNLPTPKMRKDAKLKKISLPIEQPGNKKMGKKMKRMTKEATDSYVENLKPTRPMLENFNFKQKAKETDKQFLRRVENETNSALTQSKIADHFDTSENDKIKSILKAKLVAEKREKKKQKLKDEQEIQTPVKKEEIRDFSSLQDEEVAFGEVVHAPPVLSVLPKKAISQEYDRPGLRMPELKEAFSKEVAPVRKKGETVKRKNLSTRQQFESDAKRETFVEAYRLMKKKRKLN